MTVAAISFVTYVLAGFVRSPWICLPVGAVLVIGVLSGSPATRTKNAPRSNPDTTHPRPRKRGRGFFCAFLSPIRQTYEPL